MAIGCVESDIQLDRASRRNMPRDFSDENDKVGVVAYLHDHDDERAMSVPEDMILSRR